MEAGGRRVRGPGARLGAAAAGEEMLLMLLLMLLAPARLFPGSRHLRLPFRTVPPLRSFKMTASAGLAFPARGEGKQD